MTEKELKDIKEKAKEADGLIAIIKKIDSRIPEIKKSEVCLIETTREEYNKGYDPASMGWGNNEYDTIKTLINADTLGVNPNYFNAFFKDVIVEVLLKFKADAQEKLDNLKI